MSLSVFKLSLQDISRAPSDPVKAQCSVRHHVVLAAKIAFLRK